MSEINTFLYAHIENLVDAISKDGLIGKCSDAELRKILMKSYPGGTYANKKRFVLVNEDFKLWSRLVNQVKLHCADENIQKQDDLFEEKIG